MDSPTSIWIVLRIRILRTPDPGPFFDGAKNIAKDAKYEKTLIIVLNSPHNPDGKEPALEFLGSQQPLL